MTYLVEIEIHRAEVDLKLGGVLFLLEQLLLRFSFLPGFPLLELFLGLASFPFLFLVFLLFLIVSFLLHRSADGLWSASVADEVLELRQDFFRPFVIF